MQNYSIRSQDRSKHCLRVGIVQPPSDGRLLLFVSASGRNDPNKKPNFVQARRIMAKRTSLSDTGPALRGLLFLGGCGVGDLAGFLGAGEHRRGIG